MVARRSRNALPDNTICSELELRAGHTVSGALAQAEQDIRETRFVGAEMASIEFGIKSRREWSSELAPHTAWPSLRQQILQVFLRQRPREPVFSEHVACERCLPRLQFGDALLDRAFGVQPVGDD